MKKSNGQLLKLIGSITGMVASIIVIILLLMHNEGKNHKSTPISTKDGKIQISERKVSDKLTPSIQDSKRENNETIALPHIRPQESIKYPEDETRKKWREQWEKNDIKIKRQE